jgi:hypothetical protein
MAGITFSEVQQIDSLALANSLVALFTGTKPTASSPQWFTKVSEPVQDATSFTLVLQSAPALDALLNTDPSQSYRMAIKQTRVNPGLPTETRTTFTLYFGSSDQITANGGVVNINPACIAMELWTAAKAPSAAREFSYRMTLTDRGFALALWSVSNINKIIDNSLIVVQRPVNPTSGAPKLDGEAPIFAIKKSVNDTTSALSMAVIRQVSDPVPDAVWTTLGTPGVRNLYRCTLDWSHPNLFDNYSHIIKFPFGFATDDALYLEEMDLVCLVNATAFAYNQDIKITMYGETAQRAYKATWGAVEYGRPDTGSGAIPRVVGGARIGILSVGGGL